MIHLPPMTATSAPPLGGTRLPVPSFRRISRWRSSEVILSPRIRWTCCSRFTAVPEPATRVLAGIGTAGGLGQGWRRRK
jgi:hypothetical protein